MLAITTQLPLWHSGLLLFPATAALSTAAIVATQRNCTITTLWKSARAASLVMMVAAGAGILVRTITTARTTTFLRSDTVGVTVLMLVSFIGWVVIRYSQAYLRGDGQERTYLALLLATIASVCTVVVVNHLALLVVAWTSTSLALHGLLTFFGNRPVAVTVAHKKFILARVADLSMIAAVICFGVTFDTLRIDRMTSRAATFSELPMGANIGMMFVALAVLLKCAQLPFHGWLIQVMEAPTPVSALLHAGVVNLGGFVLLRFAPIVDRSIETRTLLVVVGCTTAVISALVMTTRISIKVFLAWSTCAQMGFMIVQCGLGLWEMALLHLLAHSLYKAHAFLSAGGIVRQTQRRQLTTEPEAPTFGSIVLGVSFALSATFASGWVWGSLPFSKPPSATVWVMAAIVAVALVPLLTTNFSGRKLMLIGPPLAIPLAYFALHDLFGHLVPTGVAAPPALLFIVIVAFGGLFIVQAICTVSPSGKLPRRLYPWIYGGLFIDDAFTRLAFGLWAPPPPSAQSGLLQQVKSVPVFQSRLPDHQAEWTAR